MDINYWRIKLRDNHGGENLWGPCRKHGVIAITYEGVENVDLRLYSRSLPPPRWGDLQPGQKGSISLFAWDIRSGDVIYVGDSKSKSIVAVGSVRGRHGENPYRFALDSPITPAGGRPWRHLIDIDWDRNFRPFSYHDKAGQTTLIRLDRNRVHEFDHLERLQLLRSGDAVPAEDEKTYLRLLQEGSYFRYTAAETKEVCRQHVALSNRFKLWVWANYRVAVTQEQDQIDAVFKMTEARFLVEFKIAYNGEARYAIRQALGQLLEYNYYPLRSAHDRWLIVLDCPPAGEDLAFIRSLHRKLNLPLFIGWEEGGAFVFDDPQAFHCLIPQPLS